MCYLVTIPEFGDGVTFHIVKKNFQVNVDPQTVFESEAAMGNPIPPPPVDGERAQVEMLCQTYSAAQDFVRRSSNFVRRE